MDQSTLEEGWTSMGARFLQWPHHGAKNSTSEGFPELIMAESKVLGVRSRTDEATHPRLKSDRPTKSKKLFIMYMTRLEDSVTGY